MHVGEALILGVIQGLTEFLPISSSAHLALLPQLLGWQAELLHSLSFDVALHFGTLVAVVAYFRRDLINIAKEMINGMIKGKPWQEDQAKLGWLIIVATLPVVAIALSCKNWIETVFRHPISVAVMLILFGLVMAWADQRLRQQQRSLGSMTWKEGLMIGLAQSLALMPGVSRSGITISAGLFLGFSREQSARFAFLLSLPSIIGATLFTLRELITMTTGYAWTAMLVGTGMAAVVGYGCIAFLLAFLKKQSLIIFVVYRIGLGLFIISWFWFRANN